MNNPQRVVLICSLCLFAVCSPLYFLQYHEARSGLPTADEFFSDLTNWPANRLIIRTGPAGSDTGVYSREGFTANSAALLGLATPGILLTAAAFLWAGRVVNKNQTQSEIATTEQAPQRFWGNGLRTLWEGGHSLPRAFWGYYVLGAAGCLFVSLLAVVPFAFLHLSPLGYLVAYALMAIYGTVATVGVWRSADASTPPFWPATLAKAVVVYWTFGVFVYLANGGLRRIFDLITQ